MADDSLRLTRAQATKLWDRAFAASYHEVGEDHPARNVMVKLARFLGEELALRFISTGEIDVTVGMPRGSRYQRVAEGTAEAAPAIDGTQSARMHELAARTGQPIAGSL